MGKKILVLVLVCILVFPLGLTAKEKRGADLIVQETDGTLVRGEVIAVKENSLLLLDRESGADVTVDIGVVSVITIVKKQLSTFFLGAGLGTLAGVGAAYAFSMTGDLSEEGWTGLLVVIGGLGGFLIGGITGAVVGMDKIIELEGRSDSEIQEILEYLRKKARIPNF